MTHHRHKLCPGRPVILCLAISIFVFRLPFNCTVIES